MVVGHSGVGPPPQGSGAQPPYGGPGQPQYGQQPGGGPRPQQGWTGAPPPPNNGGKGKWILIGLALVAIIAVSIVGTVLVLRPDSGGGNGSSNTANGASEFASANDTGPANIITEDPTCEAWRKVSAGLDAAAPEWNKQDYSVPATDWTPAQRAVFENESAALTNAIPNLENLAKQTPHRAMRQIYVQAHAYAQRAVSAIANYSASDKPIVAASNQFIGVLNKVCDAIYFRAAQQTAPLISAPPAPSNSSASGSDGALVMDGFLTTDDSSCGVWTSMVERFDKDNRTEAWGDLDPQIRATEWTPENKAVIDAVVPVLTEYADDMERSGRESGNAAWEDLSVIAAQYMRAYVQAIPTFTPNVGYAINGDHPSQCDQLGAQGGIVNSTINPANNDPDLSDDISDLFVLAGGTITKPSGEYADVMTDPGACRVSCLRAAIQASSRERQLAGLGDGEESSEPDEPPDFPWPGGITIWKSTFVPLTSVAVTVA